MLTLSGHITPHNLTQTWSFRSSNDAFINAIIESIHLTAIPLLVPSIFPIIRAFSRKIGSLHNVSYMIIWPWSFISGHPCLLTRTLSWYGQSSICLFLSTNMICYPFLYVSEVSNLWTKSLSIIDVVLILKTFCKTIGKTYLSFSHSLLLVCEGRKELSEECGREAINTNDL